jgi:Trk K+ transport system NAD-binding subunit
LIIAASIIGLELGIVTPSVNTVIVLVAIVTATLSPMAFALLSPKRQGGIPFVVVAGAGSVGRALAKRLETGGARVSFIDRDARLADELDQEGFRMVAGDGYDLDTLRKAGIAEATSFVAVTPDDDANLAACEVVRREFDVPQIVARLNDSDYAEAFQAAGVRVVSVAQATSVSLVNAVLRPNLFEMMVEEPQGYDILEVRLINSAIAGRQLKDVRLPGNSLIMLLRREGEILVPRGQTSLEMGDVLTVAGDEESVRETAILLGNTL